MTERTVERLRIGTAPDSWGVWFADDPRQVPWPRFLDEASAAGYTWIELGPHGYLPTDPGRLQNELGERGLRLASGVVFTGFHKQGDQWQRAWDQAVTVARLARELGAEHLVVIPDLWRSDASGETIEPRTLDDRQWERLTAGHDQFGKAILEQFGMRQQFHPHVDSHVGTRREVERFLHGTDPAYTNLCLDTGHFAYYGGDSLRLVREHPERIRYLHVKQIDPELRFEFLKNDAPFGDAVAQEVMVEPPRGEPELGPIVEAAAAIDPEMFVIVEQDMYGCELDRPFAIAERTRTYLLDVLRATVQG
ncbi:MAG: sugar phosphate isomerase/epimerase [Candidatus Dormiibacterota bacterium]